jgi:hypothetical protein
MTAQYAATVWDSTGICPNQVAAADSYYQNWNCGWKLSVPKNKLSKELSCNTFLPIVEEYKYNNETKTFWYKPLDSISTKKIEAEYKGNCSVGQGAYLRHHP